MDLAQFDTSAIAEDGIDLQLKHPVTGLPLTQGDASETPITIRIAGADSARFRKVERANRDRRLKAGFRRTPTAAELDAEGLDLLASCTLGWAGIVLDGQPLEFTQANVKILYKRLLWVRKQVDAAMGDRSLFFQPSPTS